MGTAAVAYISTPRFVVALFLGAAAPADAGAGFNKLISFIRYVFMAYYFEAFPYPGITGQNWLLSREIQGFIFLNKRKLTTKNSYAFKFCH